ncbi:MAG: tripartite tricarboxylate transporter TctB family protein [Deltaproteobacteria bacterium]|nr:MAG: tripartite tricarboxylate transporter TctB family protein [Deltaproteobacteria bacterium]
MEEKIEKRPGERILIWFLLLFSVFILIQAIMIRGLESLSSSGVFPIFIASIMIMTMLRLLWKKRAQYSALKIRDDFKKGIPIVFPKTVAIYAAILVLYILLLYPLHFWVSSYLFLVGSFVFLRGARPLQSLFIGAGLLVVIYFLFQYLFRVIFW